jgi:hypothetical protein
MTWGEEEEKQWLPEDMKQSLQSPERKK